MNGILKQYFQTNSYKKLEKSEPENQAGPQDQIHIDLDDVDTFPFGNVATATT